jgi:Cu/Ag efflux protein CusF
MNSPWPESKAMSAHAVPLAAFLMLATPVAFAQAQTPAQPPTGAVVGRAATATATVAAIDMATREVTLRREDGQQVSVVAGPEVRNLDQVKVGDRVVLDYVEAIAAEIVRPGDTRPATEQTAAAGRAQPGQRPAAVAGDAVRVRVKIDAVDREAGRVTFTGPRGGTRTVTVQRPEMQAFVRTLSPGEEVDITFTEAVAIRVEPAR